MRPDEIASYYDDLPLETIYAALTSYLHNQSQIDAYIAEINRSSQELECQAAALQSPASKRIHALLEQTSELKGA